MRKSHLLSLLFGFGLFFAGVLLDCRHPFVYAASYSSLNIAQAESDMIKTKSVLTDQGKTIPVLSLDSVIQTRTEHSPQTVPASLPESNPESTKNNSEWSLSQPSQQAVDEPALVEPEPALKNCSLNQTQICLFPSIQKASCPSMNKLR